MSEGGSPPAFAQLQSLYITRNALGQSPEGRTPGDGWTGIAALDNLPSLRELRSVGNPLFEMPSCDPLLAREWIIGRVSKLTHLDGSEIRPEDRVMGEKKYLRECHMELFASGHGNSAAPTEAFMQQHPRFEALNSMYEDVQHEKRGADASKSKLASNLVELTITSPIEAHAEKEPVVKRVTLSMSVGKLKALCQRLFKVKGGPRHMKLTYIAPETDGGCGSSSGGGSGGGEGEEEGVKQVELEEWDSDLQYYSVETGGSVVVESLK
jgi:hypothetical protein